MNLAAHHHHHWLVSQLLFRNLLKDVLKEMLRALDPIAGEWVRWLWKISQVTYYIGVTVKSFYSASNSLASEQLFYTPVQIHLGFTHPYRITLLFVVHSSGQGFREEHSETPLWLLVWT